MFVEAMEDHQPTTGSTPGRPTRPRGRNNVRIRGGMAKFSNDMDIRRRPAVKVSQPAELGQPNSMGPPDESPNPSSSSRSLSLSAPLHIGDAQLAFGQNQTSDGSKIGRTGQIQRDSAASAGIVIFVLLGVCLCVLSLYLCFVRKRVAEREKSKDNGRSDDQIRERSIAVIVEETSGDDEDGDDLSFNDLENASTSSATDSLDFSQSFNDENDLSTLDEDEPSIFVGANPAKLGTKHSVLNVHRCASATCICRKQGNNVFFHGTKPKGAEPVLSTDPREADAWFQVRARAHLYVNQADPTKTLIALPKNVNGLHLDTSSIMSDESDHYNDEFTDEGSTNMTAKEFLVKGPNGTHGPASGAPRREGNGAGFVTEINASEDKESISDYVLNREDEFTVETTSDYVLNRPDDQMATRMAINDKEAGKVSNIMTCAAPLNNDDNESRLLAVMYGSGEGIRGRDERSPTAGRSVHGRRSSASGRSQALHMRADQHMPAQYLTEYED